MIRPSICRIAFLAVVLVPLLILAQTATDPFALPTLKHNVLITANSMFLKEGIVKLTGNVKAVQGSDTLTCQIAFMRNNPLWVLASVTPRLHRLEDVKEKKSSRETVVDALSILYQGVSGSATPGLAASGAVFPGPALPGTARPSAGTSSGTTAPSGPQVISLGSAGIPLMLTASGASLPGSSARIVSPASGSSVVASMSAFQSKVPTIVGTFSASAIPKNVPLSAFAGVPGSSTVSGGSIASESPIISGSLNASEAIPVRRELQIKGNPLELLKQLSRPASQPNLPPDLSQSVEPGADLRHGREAERKARQKAHRRENRAGVIQAPQAPENLDSTHLLNQLGNLGGPGGIPQIGKTLTNPPLSQLGQLAQTGGLKQLGQGLQVLSQIGPAAQGLSALKDAERTLQIILPGLNHGLPFPLPWKKVLGGALQQVLQQTVAGLFSPTAADLKNFGLSLPENLSGGALAALTNRLGMPEPPLSEPGIEIESLLVPELEASGSVVVRIDERTWDQATHTWIIIQSEMVRGFKNPNTMKFYGDVRVKDKDHFGRGRKLTYNKASNTVILQGDAHIETERWNQKEKKFEMHILNGETVTYNLETKQATSE